MWKCKCCGEALEDTFDRCWSCGTGKDGSPPEAPVEFEEAQVESTAPRTEKRGKSNQLAALTTRYSDAYTVARVTNGFGGIIKVVGIVLAVAILVATFAAADKSPVIIGIGLFAAIVVGVLLFILGILISAIGQILKASLDSAVNTSPLLSNADRIKIMSL